MARVSKSVYKIRLRDIIAGIALEGPAMNRVTFARHFLEFVVMIPASVLAILPVIGSIKSRHLAECNVLLVCGGTCYCSQWRWQVWYGE